MLDFIRNFSKTIFAKILLVIIIIPFVFWGMGGVFSGGNTNNIAKINNKSISTEDFMNHLNSSNIELLPPIPQEIAPMNTTELVSFDTSVIDLKFRYNDEELIYDISDSKFMLDDGGGSSPENQIFIMNAADYLLGDKELIALRSREITTRPLKPLEDDEKSRWKWINILTPSILVIGFGFIRMRREKNRSKILEEIYD